MGSDIQTLIANVGFPIAISMYLLIRIEAKLLTLSDSINELSKKLREVVFGTSIGSIIDCVKSYLDNNDIKGDFEFYDDSFVWILGKNKFTFYIELHETYVNHDKLKFNKHYINYTHYHIDKSEIIDMINELNQQWGD